MVALWCIAVLSVLLFGLGLWISLRRFVTKDYFAGAANPASFTTKLSRAHGNTSEFAPFLALLMLSVMNSSPSGWVDAVMVGATASRLLVVAGFLTNRTLEAISPLKAVGAVGTYVFGLVLTFACLDLF